MRNFEILLLAIIVAMNHKLVTGFATRFSLIAFHLYYVSMLTFKLFGCSPRRILQFLHPARDFLCAFLFLIGIPLLFDELDDNESAILAVDIAGWFCPLTCVFRFASNADSVLESSVVSNN